MWESVIDRYLSWVPILEETLQGGLISLGHDAHVWRRRALAEAPSLRTLAEGRAAGLFQLVALDKLAAEIDVPVPIRKWLDRLAEAVSHAQAASGEMLVRADDAMRRMRTLSDGTNMRFLYNSDRRVFHIGYDVSEHRMDDSYYDLLASEARLGSFVSVARGEVRSARSTRGRSISTARSACPVLG
jgi:cyclic beta-1,2-glucan synthetase